MTAANTEMPRLPDAGAPNDDQRSSLDLTPCSAPLPDDEWMLNLVNRLGHALEHRTGDSITVPLDLLAHAQSALISHLGIWRDSARLNWLDGRGAQWTVKMQGVEMGTGRIRDAINMAILRVECGPNEKVQRRADNAAE